MHCHVSDHQAKYQNHVSSTKMGAIPIHDRLWTSAGEAEILCLPQRLCRCLICHAQAESILISSTAKEYSPKSPTRHAEDLHCKKYREWFFHEGHSKPSCLLVCFVQLNSKLHVSGQFSGWIAWNSRDPDTFFRRGVSFISIFDRLLWLDPT